MSAAESIGPTRRAAETLGREQPAQFGDSMAHITRPLVRGLALALNDC